MINCNPETVSTDYDTADRLYFQPLTFEDVMAVDRDRAVGRRRGVVPRAVRRPDAAQARARAAGRRRADSRHVARLDRPGRGSQALRGAAVETSTSRSRRAAPRPRARRRARSRRAIGFPVVVRPSYVLGGRGMAIVYDVGTLDRYMTHAVDASPEHPVLDRQVPRGRVRVRRRRRSPTRPARSSSAASWSTSRRRASTPATARASCRRSSAPSGTSRRSATTRGASRGRSKVVGLMNVQYAIKDDVVYVLEVNPRASRTVPYLSKATGVSLAKVAAKVMAGRTLAELGLTERPRGGRRVREEPGVPVRALPGRRHDSRPGDEVDRRGDGRVDELRRRVREGAAGGRAAAAGARHARSSASTTTTRRTCCRSRAIWRSSASA